MKLKRLTLAMLASLGLLVLPIQSAGAAGPIPPELRQIEAQVTQVRGLKPKADVSGQLLSRAEWRERLRRGATPEGTDTSNEDNPADSSRRLLVLLGMVEAGADPQALGQDFLGSAVQGIYEPSNKTLTVILDGDKPTVSDRITYAHEYTHALQDQHFGIRKLKETGIENGDFGDAVNALIEGDATLSMVLWARQFLSPAEFREATQGAEGEQASNDASSTPKFLLREALFPYDEGASFVASLYRRGGYAEVDKAFVDPPKSTAQILHPERYLARIAPIQVELPDVAGALGLEWRELFRQTLGEFDTRLLIEQFASRQVAERASTGWAGDQYALLTNADNEDLFVMQTVWDNPDEAYEFADAYRQTVETRYRGNVTVTETENGWTIATPEGAVVLRLDDATLTMAVGPSVAVDLSAVNAIAEPVAAVYLPAA